MLTLLPHPLSAQQCIDTTITIPGGGAVRNLGIADIPLAFGLDERRVVVTAEGGVFIFVRDFATLDDRGAIGTGAPIFGMTEPDWLNFGDYSVFLQQNGLNSGFEVFSKLLPLWGEGSALEVCSASFQARPILHLFRNASEQFQETYPPGQDIVYFSTCDTEGEANQITARDAISGRFLWRFNSAGGASVAAISGMVLDEATDTLYAATNPRSSSQDSIWALNVFTSAVRWSANVGPVWSPPVLHNGRLYVANIFGVVYALNPSDGNVIWSFSNGGIPLIGSLVVGTLPSGDPVLVVQNFFGELQAIRDSGDSGGALWSTAVPSVAPIPQTPDNLALDPLSGTLFVGHTSDGKIHELDLETGKLGALHSVDVDGGIVGPIKLYRSLVTAGNELQIFAGSSSGTIAKICGDIVPITNEVSLSVSTNVGSEADGTVITVTASTTATKAAFQSVDVEVTGGTDDDFTLSDTTIFLLPGTINENSVTLTILDDQIFESPSEDITLTLINLSAGLIPGSVMSQTITILDNEAQDVDVAKDANIGAGVVIGSGSQINKAVNIGDGTQLGTNVTIDKNSSIGSSSSLGNDVKVGQNSIIGDNVQIGQMVEIGKNCIIANNITIGNNTKIGQGCNIYTNAVIGADVEMGSNVTVLAGTVIPNDTFIPAQLTVPPLL